MEYEKKYKEAVEKIRNLLDEGEKKGYTIVAYEKDFESIFPELAESEDEKIRKELIGFIQDEIDSINRLVSGDYDDRDADDIAHQKWCKKVLTWLEKQGQSKKISIWKHWKDGIAGNGDDIPVFLIKNGLVKVRLNIFVLMPLSKKHRFG